MTLEDASQINTLLTAVQYNAWPGYDLEYQTWGEHRRYRQGFVRSFLPSASRRSPFRTAGNRRPSAKSTNFFDMVPLFSDGTPHRHPPFTLNGVKMFRSRKCAGDEE